ncbi:hypothetical protein TNCV_4351741 [Trichonephila clavipes]|nr:hypothetical protein TNCV_4351741 [Trichonephila clavipes]
MTLLRAQVEQIRVRQSRNCQVILTNLGRPSKNICNRLAKQTEQVFGFYIICLKKTELTDLRHATYCFNGAIQNRFFDRLITADEKWVLTLANERVSVPPNFSCNQYLSQANHHDRYQMGSDAANYSSVISQNGACQNPWQSTISYRNSTAKNSLKTIHQYDFNNQYKIRTNMRLASRPNHCERKRKSRVSTFDNGTATAGSDVVQSGRPIFDDFFQHLWPYIGNNTANVVFQMVKRLWLIRIDQ